MLNQDSSPDFEFDGAKSLMNKRKHGIDFVEAQAIWLDPAFREGPVHQRDEARYLVIGRIGGKHWSAVITYRNDRVRIISVRRSRRREVLRYEEDHDGGV